MFKKDHQNRKFERKKINETNQIKNQKNRKTERKRKAPDLTGNHSAARIEVYR